MSKNEEGKDFEGLGKLLDHNYDGIQELDNPLPGWWLLTFYGAIIFAFFYFAYYQLGGGPSSDEELKAGMVQINSQLAEQSAQNSQINWTELQSQASVMGLGKEVYVGKCAVCHGANGEGLIGPNLTDRFWLHGDGSHPELYKVVLKGVLEKGMPAWEAQLKPDESLAVTVYVKSLIGTTPANGKPPQGQEVL